MGWYFIKGIVCRDHWVQTLIAIYLSSYLLPFLSLSLSVSLFWVWMTALIMTWPLLPTASVVQWYLFLLLSLKPVHNFIEKCRRQEEKLNWLKYMVPKTLCATMIFAVLEKSALCFHVEQYLSKSLGCYIDWVVNLNGRINKYIKTILYVSIRKLNMIVNTLSMKFFLDRRISL